MNQVQSSILQKVEGEVKKKLIEKGSYRKRLKDAFGEGFSRMLYRVFNGPEARIRKYQQASSFGYDQFGRDVEDGLYQYIGILRSRRLKIHTAIVLGSRAKGSWTPRSDIDITIIASNLPKEGTNLITRRLFGLRRKLILSDRPLCLGIEPSGCCDKTEFLERLERFDIQALDAIVYGKVIYDDGFWQIVETTYKRMEREYGLEQIPLKEMLEGV